VAGLVDRALGVRLRRLVNAADQADRKAPVLQLPPRIPQGRGSSPLFYPARDFLDSLAMRIWEARREGALIGCLCTLSVI